MTWGSTRPPLQDTPTIGLKTHIVAAGFLNSTSTEKSSQCQSIEAGLRPQAPPLLELAALCRASMVLVATHETLGVFSMCQGA